MNKMEDHRKTKYSDIYIGFNERYAEMLRSITEQLSAESISLLRQFPVTFNKKGV